MSADNDWGRRPTPLTTFDVLLLPAGVSQFAARPEQFQRVPARAETSFGARFDPTVEALCAGGAHYIVEVLMDRRDG